MLLSNVLCHHYPVLLFGYSLKIMGWEVGGELQQVDKYQAPQRAIVGG